MGQGRHLMNEKNWDCKYINGLLFITLDEEE